MTLPSAARILDCWANGVTLSSAGRESKACTPPRAVAPSAPTAGISRPAPSSPATRLVARNPTRRVMTPPTLVVRLLPVPMLLQPPDDAQESHQSRLAPAPRARVTANPWPARQRTLGDAPGGGRIRTAGGWLLLAHDTSGGHPPGDPRTVVAATSSLAERLGTVSGTSRRRPGKTLRELVTD